MKVYRTPYINPEGERCEVVGFVDLGKSWEKFVKPEPEPLAGCDIPDNAYMRYEELKQLNHDL